MDVKEATRRAKTYVADLFADEKVFNIGLEEVEFDENQHTWSVTIGFSRRWDRKSSLTAALGESPARTYKIVHIADADGRVLSLMDHFLSEPN